jgi:hypothetical protein
MIRVRRRQAAALLAAALCLAGGAVQAATYAFVGSWRVDQVDGTALPQMTPTRFSPIAFTGQEAAAYLFGGAADDYAISTLGDQAADINFSAWVTHYHNLGCGTPEDFPCAAMEAQDAKVSHGGYYTGAGDTSALLRDYAVGETYRNYAFRVIPDDPLPEPAAWAMLILGFAGTGAVLRRRSSGDPARTRS